MLETIATLASSGAVIGSLLSIFWIWRSSGAINHAHGIIAVVIFAFSLWQYIHHAHDPATWPHIGSGLFVLFTAGINVFYTYYLQLTVNVNRRKKQVKIDHPDRRAC